MVNITPAQLRKIFIVAKERGMDSELLHDHVHTLTGKDSLKELSIAEAIRVIDSLEGKKSSPEGMMTAKQRKYLLGLAKELGYTDEAGEVDKVKLNKFLRRKYGIDDMNWLTSKKASDAIEGLKAMKERIKGL